MAILHFNLDNKKYKLEFLEGNRVKIRQLDNINKFIIIQYFTDTRFINLIRYIRSLDFLSCKIKHYIH